MDCQEYKEIIAAHVDDVLAPAEKSAVETHLSQCPGCRQKFLWENRAKSLLKGKLASVPATPALKDKLIVRLGRTRAVNLFGRPTLSYGLATAFVLLVVMMTPYWVWQNGAPDEIFADAISRYAKVAQGATEPAQTDSPKVLAAQLLDLSPWGYHLLAKQADEFKGKEGRIFVYRGQGEEYLLAQEFEGGEILPPRNSRLVRRSSFDFVSYSQKGVNVVAWKEQDLLCVIASTIPEEELLGLAQQIATSN